MYPAHPAQLSNLVAAPGMSPPRESAGVILIEEHDQVVVFSGLCGQYTSASSD